MFVIKLLKIAIVFSTSFFLISCQQYNQDTVNNEAKQTPQEHQGTQNPQKSEDKITYTQFQSLFETLLQNLQIPNYTLENSSLGDDLIRIDKEISFNTREFLTSDGLFANKDIKSTQETMFYLNKSKDRLLTINMAYTDSSIGNDVVFYNSSAGYGIDSKLIDKVDLLTISYKNLIFSIMQTSNEKVDMLDTIDAGKALVEFLQKGNK